MRILNFWHFNIRVRGPSVVAWLRQLPRKRDACALKSRIFCPVALRLGRGYSPPARTPMHFKTLSVPFLCYPEELHDICL